MAIKDRLTFIFPMWNEEALIERTVGAACDVGRDLVLAQQIGDYEILLVDDGSTDATPALADRLAKEHERVRVAHHAENLGLGAAVRTALREATGDLVLYTDADLPADLAQLHKALRLLDIYDADIVSAYRHDRTGEGAQRAVYSYVYNTLVRALLRLRIRDVNFAFKVIRRRVIDHLELKSDGSFIDVELLAKAQRLGFHVIQFGVDYFPRSKGTSTLSSPRVILGILRDLGGLYREIRRTRPVTPSSRR